jgi:hypothetical protein
MESDQTDAAEPTFDPTTELPFGPSFFLSVLPDRIAIACEAEPRQVPVVWIRLADGTLLDLCHVPALTPQYIIASAYRDAETCDDMDLMFVPYPLITWVKIALFEPTRRSLGFRLTLEPSVRDDDA